ncbi:hypothetical protein SERLADRAFT_432373 [Serpula lacrymans var. lacrymans S7.9]|uniref:Uncharacterized protein n=1 Tax=Serpula lacrymans var. lacrymans (strain S7.9) TaxID=578457 RepID=F8ND06_SERL9|nr:uncharacterized protein SERLADRAFT_432373 [Serpula lacrymans var. lacrymans S7.9]EGO30750.1 hypothetical protein SERLADRAFT_432373 [Serpula lacrymans var. lacrymans S7.9]
MPKVSEEAQLLSALQNAKQHALNIFIQHKIAELISEVELHPEGGGALPGDDSDSSHSSFSSSSSGMDNIILAHTTNLFAIEDVILSTRVLTYCPFAPYVSVFQYLHEWAENNCSIFHRLMCTSPSTVFEIV